MALASSFHSKSKTDKHTHTHKREMNDRQEVSVGQKNGGISDNSAKHIQFRLINDVLKARRLLRTGSSCFG